MLDENIKEKIANRTPDSEWLQGRVADRGYSQRSLAHAMELDHSNVSRILRGEIDATGTRLTQLSHFLDIEVDELMRRLGYPVNQGRRVRLGGLIQPDGSVKPAPARFVLAGADPECMGAYQFAFSGAFENAVAYTGRAKPAESLVGRACIVEDDSGFRLRVLRPGVSRLPGRYNLSAGPGTESAVEEDVAISMAQPVLWIRI